MVNPRLSMISAPDCAPDRVTACSETVDAFRERNARQALDPRPSLPIFPLNAQPARFRNPDESIEAERKHYAVSRE